jgi:hypothetical protein
MALQIGIMVAFTQVIPEYQVQFMGVVRAKVKVSSLPSVLRMAALTRTADFTYGVPWTFDCDVHCWFPKSMDSHPIWMVCELGLPEVLQEEHERAWRRVLR